MFSYSPPNSLASEVTLNLGEVCTSDNRDSWIRIVFHARPWTKSLQSPPPTSPIARKLTITLDENGILNAASAKVVTIIVDPSKAIKQQNTAYTTVSFGYFQIY
ncbi:hypothetical protein AHF37_10831 [Paragonimus kellicotti]|nr:hypothetical protein AHF37_10831 [Paragonimus kellicotti]